LGDLQDYVELLKKHREFDADVTIATHSVGWGQATRRGLVRVDPDTGAPLLQIAICLLHFSVTLREGGNR